MATEQQIITSSLIECNLEELQDIMDNISKHIAEKFGCLREKLARIQNILENNDVDVDFDRQELFEEKIDQLIHQYSEIKEQFKKGREIRCFKEKKEKEKLNEIRYARNVLAQLGIHNIQ